MKCNFTYCLTSLHLNKCNITIAYIRETAGRPVICSVSVVEKRQCFFRSCSIEMKHAKAITNEPTDTPNSDNCHTYRIEHSTPISNGNTIWHINWTLCTHHKRTYAIGAVFAQSITQPFWMLTIAWSHRTSTISHIAAQFSCRARIFDDFVLNGSRWVLHGFSMQNALRLLWIWRLALVNEYDHNLRRFFIAVENSSAFYLL